MSVYIYIGKVTSKLGSVHMGFQVLSLKYDINTYVRICFEGEDRDLY